MAYVFIQLTVAGTDTGPFNLYSNADGYTSAFESGVSKSSLLSGIVVEIPVGTVVVRISSDNPNCSNYINIPVTSGPIPTTSTTTIPEINILTCSNGFNNPSIWQLYSGSVSFIQEMDNSWTITMGASTAIYQIVDVVSEGTYYYSADFNNSPVGFTLVVANSTLSVILASKDIASELPISGFIRIGIEFTVPIGETQAIVMLYNISNPGEIKLKDAQVNEGNSFLFYQGTNCPPLPSTTTSTSSTSTTTTTLPVLLTCDQLYDEDQNSEYPKTIEVNTTSSTGYMTLNVITSTTPLRYIVIWDGNVVIDTGYLCSINDYNIGGSNRSSFITFLNGKTDPITGNIYPDFTNYILDGYPDVIQQSSGNKATFIKTTSSPDIANLYIYAGLSIAQPNGVTLYCPGTGPTTTITTTVNYTYSDCDVIFNLQGGGLYSYNPDTSAVTYLGVTAAGIDIAMTDDKLWIIPASGGVVYEYNITLSPWSISPNRTITGFTGQEAGLDAINNTTLIHGGIDIKQSDISGSVSVSTTLFTLSPSSVVSGDILYLNNTDEYIIAQNGMFNTMRYITKYTSSGIVLVQNAYDYTMGGPSTPFGMFVHNSNLYLANSNGDIYSLDWDTLDYTLYDSISVPSSIYGASQPISCRNTPSTTTSTTIP